MGQDFSNLSDHLALSSKEPVPTFSEIAVTAINGAVGVHWSCQRGHVRFLLFYISRQDKQSPYTI